MAEKKQLLWPQTKGFYTKQELGYLCSCLGYPSDLFLNCLHAVSRTESLRSEYMKCLAGKPLSERLIKQLLDSKRLQLSLEKRFNRYDCKYNVKVIRKAMWLLRHQKMSFAEISEARVAFEVYSFEDGSGLPANVDTVLLVLKMGDRVISPLKLESEIQKQQHVVDVPSRIQLYELFSLMLLTEKASDTELEVKRESSTSVDDVGNSTVSLPRLDQILMTSQQKTLAFLDKQYRASLYREVQPSSEVIDTEHIVSAAPRRDLRVQSKLQLEALAPSLELSQTQLLQVRKGGVVLSNEQHRAIESSLSTRQPSPSHKQGDHISSRQSHRASSKQDLPQTTRNREDSAEESMFNERQCVKSVMRARQALVNSFTNLPQQKPSVNSTEGLVKVDSSMSVRPSTVPDTVRRPRAWLYKPLVTSNELLNQQGRINDLKWESLTLNSSKTHAFQ